MRLDQATSQQLVSSAGSRCLARQAETVWRGGSFGRRTKLTISPSGCPSKDCRSSRCWGESISLRNGLMVESMGTSLETPEASGSAGHRRLFLSDLKRTEFVNSTKFHET